MKKIISFAFALSATLAMLAQTNPAISAWMQNTTNIMGRHYVSGNSTPINDAVLANVQSVKYSTNWVYVATNGIPAYITGPFQDGNPSLATSQNATFKMPLNPTRNTGTATPTNGGNIGIFINGVALFDYRDGVAWNNTTQALCGGPGNTQCPGGMGTQAWNRDAIPAEKNGFDCAKAHPAMGNYHHHQNPSAFNLDKVVISNVCTLYPADGLYVIDSTKHSPLVGFAYDGFPIYGAYSYKNVDGTGGIVRMKSSYSLNTATTRTNGPAVNSTYFNGYFREDYVYTAPTVVQTDYLDAHNGRFCVTPEYPNGIYCYFTTVDDNWNSAYPYAVGPTFYGNVTASSVTSITETVTTYNQPNGIADAKANDISIAVFPNPASDFIAVQVNELTKNNVTVELYSVLGQLVSTATILQGSTITYFDTQKLYDGHYFIKIKDGNSALSKNITIAR